MRGGHFSSLLLALVLLSFISSGQCSPRGGRGGGGRGGRGGGSGWSIFGSSRRPSYSSGGSYSSSSRFYSYTSRPTTTTTTPTPILSPTGEGRVGDNFLTELFKSAGSGVTIHFPASYHIQDGLKRRQGMEQLSRLVGLFSTS